MKRFLLLVEDNEDDVFFFKSAMKKLGMMHELRVARNGREAIDFLTDYIEAPGSGPQLSLVLLDLKMPYVNGLEVLKWMQGVRGLRGQPVVMLTSSEHESDIQTAYQLGASSFLVKPSQAALLNELVGTIDAYWLKFNRLPATQGTNETAAAKSRASTV